MAKIKAVVATNTRQPIIQQAATGKNAASVPSAPNVPAVRSPQSRQPYSR